MARSRRSKSKRHRRENIRAEQRGYRYNTKRESSLLYRPFLFDRPRDIIDDGRRWRPDRKVFRDVLGLQAILTENVSADELSTEKPRWAKNQQLKFESPLKANVCRRRKRRREHLFKSGSIGKGKKVSEFRKWTEDSNIKC